MLIVTEMRLYRDGLAELLGRDPRMSIRGTAARADAAVADPSAADADVVLLDTAAGDGAVSIRRIAAELPRSRIVALGVSEVEDEVLAFAEAGIAGYVTREASLGEVADAIWRAANGELACSPQMAASLLRHVRVLAARRAPAGLREALTPREREIVALIDEGLSNKQIAARLCIEIATVKNHVHNILEKLQVSRRGEAVARVRESRRLAGI